MRHVTNGWDHSIHLVSIQWMRSSGVHAMKLSYRQDEQSWLVCLVSCIDEEIMYFIYYLLVIITMWHITNGWDHSVHLVFMQ